MLQFGVQESSAMKESPVKGNFAQRILNFGGMEEKGLHICAPTENNS